MKKKMSSKDHGLVNAMSKERVKIITENGAWRNETKLILKSRDAIVRNARLFCTLSSKLLADVWNKESHSMPILLRMKT